MLKNAHAVLTGSSSSPSHVLKSTVFLKSMNDFAAFNQLYANFFGDTKPARSCVEVARLPKDVLVEMEYVYIWDLLQRFTNNDIDSLRLNRNDDYLDRLVNS